MTDKASWNTPAFDLPPVAAQVGPFPGRAWLSTWWEHRGDGELLIGQAADSLVALTLVDDQIEFAGEPDLTDYHSPLGSPAVPALTELIADLPAGMRIHLDSLPEEAATAVATALRSIGLDPAVAQHEVAAVLSLPESFDDYLASIGKKERHELRRKRRRFDSNLGIGTVERQTGAAAVALFADLHRRSAGDKGDFMTGEMEKFFGALHREAGAVIDVLRDGSGRAASAVFSFEDPTGFYLYNSAYEPEVGHYSPGNVMLSHLIERAIERGLGVFDFLKGGEAYKFRLGAAPRPLYAVSAVTGERP